MLFYEKEVKFLLSWFLGVLWRAFWWDFKVKYWSLGNEKENRGKFYLNLIMMIRISTYGSALILLKIVNLRCISMAKGGLIEFWLEFILVFKMTRFSLMSFLWFILTSKPCWLTLTCLSLAVLWYQYDTRHN